MTKSRPVRTLAFLAACSGAFACTTNPAAPAAVSPPADLSPVVAPRPPAPGDVIEPPRALHRVPPLYPPELRQTGTRGTVRAGAVVGADGRVTEVEILHADDPLFAQAVRDVLPGWIFQPATVNGEPEAFYYQLTIQFDLD